jgi:hypothetical protein
VRFDQGCDRREARAIWRHGPHHAAQKSIRSGMLLDAACFSKFAEVSSTGSLRNNGLQHFPQCPPSSSRAAGTRLSVVHVGHTMTSLSPSVISQTFSAGFS